MINLQIHVVKIAYTKSYLAHTTALTQKLYIINIKDENSENMKYKCVYNCVQSLLIFIHIRYVIIYIFLLLMFCCLGFT